MTSYPYSLREILRIAAAATTLALFAPAAPSAFGASATLNAGLSDWDVVHNPGGPGGTPLTALNYAIQGTSTPTVTFSNTITFEPGGTTKAKAGVGRSQSATVAKVVFPSGVGVDQTDPVAAPSQSASACKIDFNAVFDITGAGSFGPSVNGTFSVPFGAKVGAGGFALFECDVHWDAVINGVTTPNVRAPFTINAGTSPSGLFSSPGTYLTSFNAPAAAFSPSSIPNTAGTDQLIVHGFIQFVVNNDEAPSLGAFPEVGTGVDQFLPKNIDEEMILQMVPEVGFEVVPEPAAAALLAGLAPLLLRRRRSA
jgi:hypothetical protein